MPGKAEGKVLKLRGTITAIDKEKQTITIKGSGGRTLTVDVQDPSKLDAVKVGDPVVGTYVEALAVQVRPAGSTTPGATASEARATSKPGENPAGAIRREVSVTGKIVKIDAILSLLCRTMLCRLGRSMHRQPPGPARLTPPRRPGSANVERPGYGVIPRVWGHG